jgi:hypothetical protein
MQLAEMLVTKVLILIVLGLNNAIVMLFGVSVWEELRQNTQLVLDGRPNQVSQIQPEIETLLPCATLANDVGIV